MATALAPAELKSLTGARGLAAWLVVLFHLRLAAGSQLPGWLHPILAKGYLAVDFFFVLSGFVLWLNYQQTLRDRGLSAVPRFIARRIARIWPLHAVILGGAALYALALTLRGTPDPAQFPWLELPLHLLLVQNWGFTDSLTWNDPAWSISCELAAYLLFPLLVLAIDWRRFAAQTLLLFTVAIGAALALTLESLGAQSLNSDIPRLGLLRAVGEFTMGTLIAAVWRQWRERPPPLLSTWPVALAVLVALALTRPEVRAVAIAWPLILLALALADGSRFNPLRWAPIHYIGRISYSTYLVHYLLFILFKLLLLDRATDVPLPMLGLYLLLTLAASVVLHHGVELPGQRLLNRRFDNLLERLRTARPLSPA